MIMTIVAIPFNPTITVLLYNYPIDVHYIAINVHLIPLNHHFLLLKSHEKIPMSFPDVFPNPMKFPIKIPLNPHGCV